MITTKNIKKFFEFLFNPRFLLCFGLAWIITNGWAYILFALGGYFKSKWMIGVSSAYLAFLWLPISPEKIVTVTIALGLLKWLFPNDQKTLAVLNDLLNKTKVALQKNIDKWKARREQRKRKDQSKD